VPAVKQKEPGREVKVHPFGEADVRHVDCGGGGDVPH